MGMRVARGLEVVQSRVRHLQELARQVRGLMGEEGLRELADSIRAHREAGRLVALGGVEAALALHEARGDVAQAQAMMSRARRGSTGAPAGRGGATTGSERGAAVADEAPVPTAPRSAVDPLGPLAALVDEQVGLTSQVVKARLAEAETESTGSRLSMNMADLEKHRPSLEAPPHGEKTPTRWDEYVVYYEDRLTEIKEGTATKGPLTWEGYERMRAGFSRGVNFERAMVKLLREDAQRPRAQRRWLGDFDMPRIEAYVGVKKPGTGLRYADVLVIEEGDPTHSTPRIETLSFKSRDLSRMGEQQVRAQMTEDASEALRKYGGVLDIRRESLQSFLHAGSSVPVQKVRLVYEGGELKPLRTDTLSNAINATRKYIPEVEVSVQ